MLTILIKGQWPSAVTLKIQDLNIMELHTATAKSMTMLMMMVMMMIIMMMMMMMMMVMMIMMMTMMMMQWNTILREWRSSAPKPMKTSSSGHQGGRSPTIHGGSTCDQRR